MASWLFRVVEEYLGGAGSGQNEATGSLALNGAAAGTSFPTGVALGSLALNGSAVATTSIEGVALGTMELHGAAVGFQSRFVRTLKACGHPLITAVQDWIIK